MIVQGVLRQVAPEQVYLAFHDDRQRDYRCLPLAAVAPHDLTDLDRLRQVLGVQGRRADLPELVLGYRKKPLKLWFHTMRADAAAALGRDDYFLRRGTRVQDWQDHRQRGRAAASPPAVPSRPILADLRPGDQLVLIDDGKDNPVPPAVFGEATRRGAAVVTFVHDLIPINAPHFFPDQSVLAFDTWLRDSRHYTTAYIANSASTEADLRRYLSAQDRQVPLYCVPLAQAPLPSGASTGSDPVVQDDADARRPVLSTGGSRVRRLLKRPFVLIVGTREIRKNLWQVAQAWSRLAATPGLDVPTLVVAGRAGYANDDFDLFMAATGNLQGWVAILDQTSDRELEFLYRNCLFTVTASFYEGWGLPIGESLSYGKTAVVSGTSSMPEVGQDMVEYCDPHSIDSIHAACLSLIASPDRRSELEARIAAARLRSWDDVARDLVTVLDRAAS